MYNQEITVLTKDSKVKRVGFQDFLKYSNKELEQIVLFSHIDNISNSEQEDVDYKDSFVDTELMYNTGLECNAIKYDDKICVIGYKEFEFGKIIKSPDSNAIYEAHLQLEGIGYLLQYMPSESKSSTHYHKETTETIHNLEGELMVVTNQGEKVLKQGSETIHPGTVHKVETGSTPALSIIEMMNGPGILSMADHYHLENVNEEVDKTIKVMEGGKAVND